MQTVVAPRNPYAKLVTCFRAAYPDCAPAGAGFVVVHADLDAGFTQVYDADDATQWDFPAMDAVARGFARSEYRAGIVFGALKMATPQARLTVFDVYALDGDAQHDRPYADRLARLCDLFGGCDVQVQSLGDAAAPAPTPSRIVWADVVIAEPGDPAFEDVLGHAIQPLDRFLRRTVPNAKPQDTEVAAADAVTKALLAYRGTGAAAPTPGDALMPWLHRIALNALKDIWKRGGKKKKEWEQRVLGAKLRAPGEPQFARNPKRGRRA